MIHHHRLGTALVLIQLLLGALLLALALYFLLWSPQLNIRDVPHWSAVSVRNVFFSPELSTASFIFETIEDGTRLPAVQFSWEQNEKTKE